MTTWIALLRGINVGGNNILPMKELRALLEGEGFENIRTYIQSGNCVFMAGATDANELADKIAGRIERMFGFKPAVLVLKRQDLQQVVERNPFATLVKDPKTMHFSFLKSPATDPDLHALEAIKIDTEQFKLIDSVFYLYAPEGIGRSKLATQVEKKLGVPATARNLRTVLKLLELAD
ncbi:MAG: DUF1697 domain-containing protein [Hyphomonadaceae bacterium]|nr:DUF1697 domain-containing protein [Hyphomonadaceae bacterium]